jgi:hypothetical protein
MRKLLLAIAIGVLGAVPLASQSQEPIRSFPYDEDFSERFVQNAPAFLPGWWCNSGEKGQLFQYNWQGRSDLYSLALLPEGRSPITAQVHVNLKGRKNMFVGFWVATLKNGGARDVATSYLSVSVSANGGKDFGFVVPVGPSFGFPNETTTFQYFQYPLPAITDGNDNVVVRFSVWTEGSLQQPAILLLDDIRIAQAPGDVAPPFIVSLD